MPQIQIYQLCHIVGTLYESDHGEPLAAKNNLSIDEIVNVLKQRAKGNGKGSQFTRRQLMNRPDWNGDNGWKASEKKQLN